MSPFPHCINSNAAMVTKVLMFVDYFAQGTKKAGFSGLKDMKKGPKALLIKV